MSSPLRRRCYIDYASGDKNSYLIQLEQYNQLRDWLDKNGKSYGINTDLDELTDVEKEMVIAVYTHRPLSLSSLSIPSLLLPRLYLTLSPSPSLQKTTTNFLSLLTDSSSLLSKRSPGKKLRYEGSPVHRIEKDFVVQGGDLTRGDGMGGESIWGGSFQDEKEGLKVPFEYGTLAMANSGKNTNTSQYFITLATSPNALKKLTGKYVAFGNVVLEGDEGESSRRCLERLNELGDGTGGTREMVWVERCGLLEE